MFTGLVQDIGTVEEVHIQKSSMHLAISTTLDASHLNLGASVACNGCCLTIVNVIQNIFYVDIGPETLSITRFSSIKVGDKVNLEPALRMGDALGGHQVSGHIDNVFQIKSFEKIDENFWRLILLFPKKFLNFMIAKGSIAIAGISLTIAKIFPHSEEEVCVEFMIIPHTFHNTILQFILANQTSIEVEFDQSTKAIASLVQGMLINYSQTIT